MNVLKLSLAVVCAFAGPVLAQQAVPARVDVSSQPDGAEVFVDGDARGKAPVTLLDLRPGRHYVKCRLDNYVEGDAIVEVQNGAYVTRTIALEPEKGLLLLKSVPENCDITVDGLSSGRTPRLITTLATKRTHRVTLRKEGYRPSTFEVKFSGRTPVVRTETLLQDSATVEVTTEPAGAVVTVNGVERGRSPVTVTVPKGRATVKLALDGYDEETRELAVNAGEPQTLAVSLKALPGTLHLISEPEGGRFYVNGEPRGRGPLTVSGLKPGDYEVRCEMPGYGPVTRTITIGNGAAPREEFRLSNVMGRLELRTSPVGAKVFVDGRYVGLTRSQDPSADVSDILPIESVFEGEHVVVVRKDGYAESTKHPKVENSKTAKVNVRLKRVFVPDIEIETSRGTVYRGMLVSSNADAVIVEIKPGITQPIPRGEIRKVTNLAPSTETDGGGK